MEFVPVSQWEQKRIGVSIGVDYHMLPVRSLRTTATWNKLLNKSHGSRSVTSRSVQSRAPPSAALKFNTLHRPLSIGAAAGIGLLAYRIGTRSTLPLLPHSRSVYTTIDSNMKYTPAAPSPFIVSQDSPLDNLLEGYKRVQPIESTLQPYAVFEKHIEQSPNDDRQYRLVHVTSLVKASQVLGPRGYEPENKRNHISHAADW